MPYRILLPSFESFTDARLEHAIDGLQTTAVSETPRRWYATTRGLSPTAVGESPLVVTVLDRSDIPRQPGDQHFFEPRGVVAWIEIRAQEEQVDRPTRLRVRLVAMELSHRLGLPVLETRNGVYCRQPPAFVAWCARESHPHIVKLGKREHVTSAPQPRATFACPKAAVATFKRPTAPLPRLGLLSRIHHGLTGRRPYLVSIPDDCAPAVIGGLLNEVEHTFRRRNVWYDALNHRLVIYAKETPQTRGLIKYFRKRTTPKRLGLQPAYSGF